MSLNAWLVVTETRQIIVQAERFHINAIGKLEFLTHGLVVAQFDSYEYVGLKDYVYSSSVTLISTN